MKKLNCEMNETWWCAHEYSQFHGTPRSVTVASRTDKFLRLEGSKRRVSIKSDYDNYFPSLGEAVDWMIERAERRRDDAQSLLDRMNRAISVMENWKKEASK